MLAVERAGNRNWFPKNFIDGMVRRAVKIVVDNSEEFQFDTES